MNRAFVIAIVGAESTGKTWLAQALRGALVDEQTAVATVHEHLREFCDAYGRTPTAGEQAAIAAEQTRRIDAAAREHHVVVADTTALMTAVYSELVFGDRGLYARAVQEHRRCDLTLLTTLDLPWQADGLQRDGPHVREPVDALLRHTLAQASIGYTVVGGLGQARLDAALAALHAARRLRTG